MLEFGIPIPFEYVENEEVMRKTRSMFRVNTDIPGAIETVHPNKFLPSKLSYDFPIKCLTVFVSQVCDRWRTSVTLQ